MPKLLLCVCLLVACTPDHIAPPDPAPVAAAPVAAAGVEPLLGVVAALDSQLVAAQLDGRILRVVAHSGQPVRAGQLIAEIDPSVLTDRLRAESAAVDAARADVAGADAAVSEARRQLALDARMFAAQAIAEETVRIARAGLARASAMADRAGATLREAEASRAALATQLSHARIVAPIDGVVSLVKAQAGEVVAPGAVIAHVFDPAKLMIRFQVPRDRRAGIVAGAVVELTVAGAAHPLRAHVSGVSTDLEPPLDFAVAEATIDPTIGPTIDPTGLAAGADAVQIGTLGDVRLVAAN